MSRRNDPTPPPAMSGRAFLSAMNSEPSPEPGTVNVWTPHGWEPLAVLPKTQLLLLGTGAKLAVIDWLPDVPHKERVRLWQAESLAVHEAHRRGTDELVAQLMPRASPPSAPSRSRVDHHPGQPLDTTERNGSERGSKSVSGVELATPTAQEVREVGRKGGFRRTSKRFSRTR